MIAPLFPLDVLAAEGTKFRVLSGILKDILEKKINYDH
jgi:hypothetical protein